MDAVVIAVAHDEFKKFTKDAIEAFFKKVMGIKYLLA